jgi:hypothetical protein
MSHKPNCFDPIMSVFAARPEEPKQKTSPWLTAMAIFSMLMILVFTINTITNIQAGCTSGGIGPDAWRDYAPPPPRERDPLPPEVPVTQRKTEQCDKSSVTVSGPGGMATISVAGDSPTLTVSDGERSYTVDLVRLIKHLPRVMVDVKDAAKAEVPEPKKAEPTACRSCREKGEPHLCRNVLRGCK